jgi:hypothetical protein
MVEGPSRPGISPRPLVFSFLTGSLQPIQNKGVFAPDLFLQQ